MSKSCFRCKNAYDISTHYTDGSKIYKICGFCRSKQNYSVHPKDTKEYVEIEKTLKSLNYNICKFNKKLYEKCIVVGTNFVLRYLVDSRKVMLMPEKDKILVPLNKNSIMYIPVDKDINFLTACKCNNTCEICFENKDNYLNCSRCNKSFCSECYKKSKLFCCMFCRYSLADHLNNSIDGQWLNLFNFEDVIYYLSSNSFYRS